VSFVAAFEVPKQVIFQAGVIFKENLEIRVNVPDFLVLGSLLTSGSSAEIGLGRAL
jgi:hypothetical protein